MKTKAKTTISKEKSSGRIYTPQFIVNHILDFSGYSGENLLKKHAIDNSCGDGAFLTEMVKRYCEEGIASGYTSEDLSYELSTYIHGIEIDSDECQKSIENVSAVAEKFGIKYVDWDIKCADVGTVRDYDGKMDFVLGNPPYVRVHHLGDSFDDVKRYSFAQNGMTDLYIVFYEIGLKMLNKSGTLGYITPSSFFNSVAGGIMRKHLVRNCMISKLIDLKHFQPFKATTYTTIVILTNEKNDSVLYYEYDGENKTPVFIESLSASDFVINGNFYFSSKDKLLTLKKILSFTTANPHFSVKNGFATLADDLFIRDFEYDDYIIPVVKASTGKHTRCFFPYENGKLIPYDTLIKSENTKKYLESNIDRFKNRSLHDGLWWGFGRTQGINDVFSCKYAINSLVRNIHDIKMEKCNPGVGVYSGLYIMTDVDDELLSDLIYSDEFITYISLLGKYKSGGYYTFSSKDLKLYLEYEYSKRGEKVGQQTISRYT